MGENMNRWATIGQVLTSSASLYPEKIAAKDSRHSLTYSELNERCCRLGNGLFDLALRKGDRVAVIAYNGIEWLEIYAAVAKAGLVAVPIMFRLAPSEYRYILEHSEARAFIVAEEFIKGVESVRPELKGIPSSNYVFLGEGKPPAGYLPYETLIREASSHEPQIPVNSEDIWILSYTSGTTGRPKGVLRSHESYIALFLITLAEMALRRDDKSLVVMPMAHINSIQYSFQFLYTYGSVYVYDQIRFDPEEILKIMAEERITFTSLVPTHYIMILDLPEEVKARYDVGSVRKLLCSSAPARRETKIGILQYFKDAQLYEGYGSSEGGLCTILRPEDLMYKMTSVGKETIGMAPIRILDEQGQDVQPGEVGELYSKGPSLFCGYWKMPEETAKGFRDGYFSAGDMARKDEDGFYYLVDRKQNMIITGGENVYPSEVEAVIASHPTVKDVAVIGIPDDKWGEAVKAVVVLREGMEAAETLEKEIMDWCRGKIAGYKRPKSIDFIIDEDMPRTPTGKILHRLLREKYGKWINHL